MLIPSAWDFWRAYASRSWPHTDGLIVYGKQKPGAPELPAEDDGITVSSASHAARLVFRYEVNGQRHFNNVRRFGQLSSADSDWTEEITQRYPQGRAVTVLYSPSDPDVAVLESGITTEAFWLPGVGLAFLLFGLAVLVFGIPAVTSF